MERACGGKVGGHEVERAIGRERNEVGMAIAFEEVKNLGVSLCWFLWYRWDVVLGFVNWYILFPVLLVVSLYYLYLICIVGY